LELGIWIYQAAVRCLPGCLSDTRQFALEGEFTQTYTAQTEFAVVSSCPSTSETTVVSARCILWFLLWFIY